MIFFDHNEEKYYGSQDQSGAVAYGLYAQYRQVVVDHPESLSNGFTFTGFVQGETLRVSILPTSLSSPKLDAVKEYASEATLETVPQTDSNYFSRKGHITSIHARSVTQMQHSQSIPYDGSPLQSQSDSLTAQPSDRRSKVHREEQLSVYRLSNEHIRKVYSEFEEKYKIIESQHEEQLLRSSHNSVYGQPYQL